MAVMISFADFVRPGLTKRRLVFRLQERSAWEAVSTRGEVLSPVNDTQSQLAFFAPSKPRSDLPHMSEFFRSQAFWTPLCFLSSRKPLHAVAAILSDHFSKENHYGHHQ
ncbi:MAG TPA: hypothetical protein VHM90_15505 [Phycisphaerae bacterium]|nr:hypothetical protein [Phycisphaerae bacterium]